MCARIAEALHQSFGSSLPQEVEALLSARGAQVSSSRLLKTSFHATFCVHMDPPLPHGGTSFAKAIVQVLGAELGDKAIFGHLQASTLVRAMELASSAGVRVPKVFATGRCASLLGPLDFVVEEFVDTQTVEDEVQAPSTDWDRLVYELQSKLLRHMLAEVDVSPLPHFKSLNTQLQWLMTWVPPWDDSLIQSLDRFAQGVATAPPQGLDPVLVHQDLNGGNVLCSELPSGIERPWVEYMGVWSEPRWGLDAVIDWESAAVADPRSLSAEEPWPTARALALVAKGSRLAEHAVRGTLPRCELRELIEGYDRAATELDEQGLLHYETWATRVKRARSAARSGLPQCSFFGGAS